MFSGIKIAMILVVLSVVGGGWVYVKGLQADLATSEANNLILENIKAEQDAVIDQLKKDFEAINKAKTEIENALAAAEQDNKTLAGKFAQYDIALWGMENPEAAEKTAAKAADLQTRNATLREIQNAVGQNLPSAPQRSTPRPEAAVR